MQSSDVISLVRNALERAGDRFKFDVLAAGVRQDGNWWYVPVVARTARGGEPPLEVVVNIYANIEEELQNDGLNVMFVPAA